MKDEKDGASDSGSGWVAVSRELRGLLWEVRVLMIEGFMELRVFLIAAIAIVEGERNTD